MGVGRVPSTVRTAVIRAAYALVRSDGPGALTLDAAAKRAGVSKGGLLYHFPNKDSLIRGMIAHALEAFDEAVESRAISAPDAPGRWLRAFVEVTFAADPEHDPGIAILAAAAINPELLEPVNEAFERWQARAVADGCDTVSATLIRLATDGLWFADIFTRTAPQGELRDDLLASLLNMVDHAAGHAR